MNSEAHGDVADDTAENAKGTGVREYQVGAEEVDVADVSDKKEAEGLKKRREQFLEARRALEMPMQDIGTARERELANGSRLETELAAVKRGRESSARVPWERSTSKAKENLNNLDTKALGRVVISSCASGYVTPGEAWSLQFWCERSTRTAMCSTMGVT